FPAWPACVKSGGERGSGPGMQGEQGDEGKGLLSYIGLAGAPPFRAERPSMAQPARGVRAPPRRRHTMPARPDTATPHLAHRAPTPDPYLDHDPFAPPRPAQAAPPRAARHRAALLALDGAFAVAALETTGLSTATCEILEFAAV